MLIKFQNKEKTRKQKPPCVLRSRHPFWSGNLWLSGPFSVVALISSLLLSSCHLSPAQRGATPLAELLDHSQSCCSFLGRGINLQQPVKPA